MIVLFTRHFNIIKESKTEYLPSEIPKNIRLVTEVFTKLGDKDKERTVKCLQTKCFDQPLEGETLCVDNAMGYFKNNEESIYAFFDFVFKISPNLIGIPYKNIGNDIYVFDVIGNKPERFVHILEKFGINKNDLIKKQKKIIIVIHGNDFQPKIQPGLVLDDEIITKVTNNLTHKNIIVFSMSHDDFDPINRLLCKKDFLNNSQKLYKEIENIILLTDKFIEDEYILALKRL